MYSQAQSPLFALPAELREKTYKLSLTADRPITDPASNLLVSEDSQDIPPTGITLLRTCRRIHDELDLAPFYASNTFRFTRPVIASWFFSHTHPRYHHLIHQVDMDLSVIDRTGNSNTGFDAGDGRRVTPEWAHYLSCGPERHDVALICTYQPEMYSTDMARVKRLSPDIVGLQDQADRMSDRFSISALNDMLSSLMPCLHITACSELVKIDLEVICIRGRHLDGAVTNLTHAIGTCAPAKPGIEAYRSEIVLLKQ